jgi:hypothetical protein
MHLITIALFVIVIICALVLVFLIIRARTLHPFAIIGGDRSKTEARIIAIFEEITGRKFDTAHPTWLRDPDSRAPLELDGYNEELGIAVEVQGPGHIKPMPGESYEKYQSRVARDEYKRAQCAAHKVALITIDYRISTRTGLRAYIESRLFDAGTVPDKPRDYIYPLDMTPWKRGT